jgi:hypothetical protein
MSQTILETALTQMEDFLEQVESSEQVQKKDVEKIIDTLTTLESFDTEVSTLYMKETRQYFEAVKASLEDDPTRAIDEGKATDIVLEFRYNLEEDVPE